MSIVRLSKVAATFACGLLALCLALQLWQAYVLAPWTRDGRVSAQVIRIAPEVSGSVEAVFVADNQRVARGDPLYRIDPRSYRLAVRQREAELEQARETLRQRDEQWRRRMQLAGAVSREEVANAGRALRIARARAEAAGAALDQARLDLRRSELRSPVDGYVTQLRVQPGDYAAAGRTNIFIVDRRSFWVTGYFEETKLRNVQVGAPATIKLMGFDPLLDGHVASIGRGVADLNESRADSFFTTKTTAKGLGLGLAICDNLLRALGGRLEMGNHLEGGAVVRLHLLPGVPGVAAMPQEETRA